MAKIYLDTNKVLDLAYRKPEIRQELENHEVHISTLSIHILCYIQKAKIPNKKLSDLLDQIKLLPFNEQVLAKSILGPTRDFEDNIQLHSAAESDCDIFLTNDKKLLKMKFFGKVKIQSHLQ